MEQVGRDVKGDEGNPQGAYTLIIFALKQASHHDTVGRVVQKRAGRRHGLFVFETYDNKAHGAPVLAERTFKV